MDEGSSPSPAIRAAGAVVFRPGQAGPEFLLLRNAEHFTWAPPKGHLEAGETEAEAARRELAEELGAEVELEFLAGFRHAVSYQIRRGGRLRTKVVTFFLARLAAGRVQRSAEHDALAWAGLETAFSLVAFEELRELLRRAAAFLEAAA